MLFFAAFKLDVANDFEGIVISGNAPTAVFEAMDLYAKDEMNLKAIVGVPVGFVGAADSKEALHNSNIPNIIVEGPKGGTPIAVGGHLIGQALNLDIPDNIGGEPGPVQVQESRAEIWGSLRHPFAAGHQLRLFVWMQEHVGTDISL